MTDAEKVKRVTSENLRRLCWARGYRGIPGLADAIGRSRVTIWRAVRHPNRFTPTYTLIEKALL